MKSALVAIDPTSKLGTGFGRFCSILRLFQARGFFPETSVASLIHAALYAMPLAWYREAKDQLLEEAYDTVTTACRGRFEFDSVRVLSCEAHENEALVARLSQFGRRKRKEVLIVSSNDRSGLPHWILGSFSETAALTASLPILVVKPHLKDSDFSREVRFVVGIDAVTPVSEEELDWIAKAAGETRAHVDLVYVEPRPRPVLGFLHEPIQKTDATRVLKRLQAVLKARGTRSSVTLLEESRSVPHTIVEFAENRKAWMIVAGNAERSTARRLLLGSTARRMLTLTERPFLSLRLV